MIRDIITNISKCNSWRRIWWCAKSCKKIFNLNQKYIDQGICKQFKSIGMVEISFKYFPCHFQPKELSIFKLPSLEDLRLSGCSSLEYFPEIPDEMENLEMLNLSNTGIKDLPCSFHNLSGLWFLKMSRNEMCKIPSVIGMMPRLHQCHISGGGNLGRISRKQEDGLHRILTHSLPSHNMICLSLRNSNLLDEFFPLALACFPNLEHLDLIGNNFTVLPECMQEFRFLYWINVDECKHLNQWNSTRVEVPSL
ncbi:disease resistance protein RPV1-like [Arachis stenosperma]|uniref:disease resistance protein RPV1-like n=1 Tax=Arachis stenosperma TaxID=217475 RepID=UPI0025AC82BC|nr:disease resistance protein RPV1-like [Arachis stenosperma]